MSAGELRFLVEIRKPSVTAGVAGDQSTITFVKHCKAFASIKWLAGKESNSDRDSTLGKAEIKMRYRSDITNKMRVHYDGNVFEIEDNFDKSSRRQYLTIMAKVVNK